jgi:hypothetical protein
VIEEDSDCSRAQEPRRFDGNGALPYDESSRLKNTLTTEVKEKHRGMLVVLSVFLWGLCALCGSKSHRSE